MTHYLLAVFSLCWWISEISGKLKNYRNLELMNEMINFSEIEAGLGRRARFSMPDWAPSNKHWWHVRVFISVGPARSRTNRLSRFVRFQDQILLEMLEQKMHSQILVLVGFQIRTSSKLSDWLWMRLCDSLKPVSERYQLEDFEFESKFSL